MKKNAYEDAKELINKIDTGVTKLRNDLAATDYTVAFDDLYEIQSQMVVDHIELTRNQSPTEVTFWIHCTNGATVLVRVPRLISKVAAHE